MDQICGEMTTLIKNQIKDKRVNSNREKVMNDHSWSMLVVARGDTSEIHGIRITRACTEKTMNRILINVHEYGNTPPTCTIIATDIHGVLKK